IRLSRTAVKDGHFDVEQMHRAYAEAFREFGVDFESLDSVAAAERIRARSVSLELAGNFDDWASSFKNNNICHRLFSLAHACDPDDWRNALRDALEREDVKSLTDLASSDRVDEMPPRTLTLFGRPFEGKGAPKSIIALLRKSHQRFPGDFWICYYLGNLHEAT